MKLTQKSCGSGSIGLAFTYNEPSIWYEYIMATAPLLKEKGLKTVLVTNGYLEKEPLEKLLPYVDACNIDVKAFNEEFYPELCRGRLEAVKNTVERAIGHTHVEITTLLIPGKNDDDQEVRDMSRWLAALNPKTVLHLSKYHSAYNMNLPSTSEDTIRKASEIAKEYLEFVYTGNLPNEENNTYCPNCWNLLIQRNAYETRSSGIKDGLCSSCRSKLEFLVGL